MSLEKNKKSFGLKMGVLVLVGAIPSILFAQQEESSAIAKPEQKPVLHGFYEVSPWTGGTHADAAIQSLAASTIPLSSYSFASTKGGRTYTGTIVGGNPFAGPYTSTSISAVVVPLKISIGTATFDPTATDSCNTTSALTSFNSSPLVLPASIAYNGETVTAQYSDGFRQAEFASLVSNKGYSNPVSYSTAAAYTISSTTVGRNGTTYSSGCSLLGIVSYSWLDSYLRKTVMPALASAKVISPSVFVVFLMKNVVQSNSTPPSVNNCCILGYHGATGSPVQTYSPMDWDTTGLFGAATHDASVASHEIGEWMDDPLGTNPTPAWGNVGQVSGCQTNWEVGDPLSGTDMPLVNGYHLQELGFFSWYFNSSTTASLGSGGKFSGNGTFKGPAKACPPGGTY